MLTGIIGHPLFNLILFNSAFVVTIFHQFFYFVSAVSGSGFRLLFTVFGSRVLSKSSRSSKRRGVSEPIAAKAQLTDHGMGLEPISSCSSRTTAARLESPLVIFTSALLSLLVQVVREPSRTTSVQS